VQARTKRKRKRREQRGEETVLEVGQRGQGQQVDHRPMAPNARMMDAPDKAEFPPEGPAEGPAEGGGALTHVASELEEEEEEEG
jgi:hypothetical protein